MNKAVVFVFSVILAILAVTFFTFLDGSNSLTGAIIGVQDSSVQDDLISDGDDNTTTFTLNNLVIEPTEGIIEEPVIEDSPILEEVTSPILTNPIPEKNQSDFQEDIITLNSLPNTFARAVIGVRDYSVQSDLVAGGNANLSIYIYNNSGSGNYSVDTLDATDTDLINDEGGETMGNGDVHWWTAGGDSSSFAFFGSDTTFNQLFANVTTTDLLSPPTDSWEYYDGSGWTKLTIAAGNYWADEGINIINWTIPGDWSTATIFDGTFGPYYYIRYNCSDGCSMAEFSQFSINATISSVPAYCDNQITTCQTTGWTTGQTYCLTADILNSAVSCMIPDVDDVTLDCLGNQIEGTNSGSTIGVSVVGYKNITITNCNISEFNLGVKFDGNADNNTLKDSYIHSNVYAGLQLLVSNLSVIYNNTFYNHSGVNDVGISFYPGSSTPAYNNITTNTLLDNYYGLYLYGSSPSNTVHDNIIEYNNVTNGDTGLYLTGGYVIDNNFTYNTFENNTYPIYLASATATYGNWFIGNEINHSANSPIYFTGTGAMAQYFVNNSINGDPYIHCYNNVPTNIENITISQENTSNYGSANIYDCNNTIIQNVTVNSHTTAASSAGHGLYLIQSYGTQVLESNFSNNKYGIYMGSSSTIDAANDSLIAHTNMRGN
ncbi:MAG: right-handed parallel beta-helix repeat-containing protein, partial [archaeon]|nr:right-handed parallel beta-helix repeat-containing protein [archaeon]